MKKVTILIPCHNEEQSLPLLYPELKALMDEHNSYAWELLFVDDGSRDATLSLVKQLRASDQRVKYVSLSRNFGKERAMLAGFDYATGDSVVIIDADLQDPPSLIPKMLSYWEEGYQDVYARRENRGREPWLRRRFSLLFYWMLDHATSYDILKNVGDFRLLDRCCIEALKQLRESERYTKGLFCWIGFKKKELTFNRHDRVAGASKWNFVSLLNLAIEGITSFTTVPLRLATVMGAVIALLSFCAIIFYMSKTIIFGDSAQGFTTLVCVSLFMGGVNLLAIGILGEYVGRIFNETKNRPVYLVNEYCTE